MLCSSTICLKSAENVVYIKHIIVFINKHSNKATSKVFLTIIWIHANRLCSNEQHIIFYCILIERFDFKDSTVSIILLSLRSKTICFTDKMDENSFYIIHYLFFDVPQKDYLGMSVFEFDPLTLN